MSLSASVEWACVGLPREAECWTAPRGGSGAWMWQQPVLPQPTICHYFIRLMKEKGLLLRCYTQVGGRRGLVLGWGGAAPRAKSLGTTQPDMGPHLLPCHVTCSESLPLSPGFPFRKQVPEQPTLAGVWPGGHGCLGCLGSSQVRSRPT